jgi:XTP/dITP diphosphohydrolase
MSEGTALGPDGEGARLVLASRNEGKLVELRRIIAEAGLPIELLGLAAFPQIGEVAETGRTFADNALLKAHAVARGSGLPAVADDSGLCVNALNGMPGVLSARWSGRHGDDQANLELLLAQLSDVPDERRGAHFACAVALALPSGAEWVVEGVMHGSVIREPRGTNGFGYDPIFVPEDGELTTAQLPSDLKDAISHRGRALRELVPLLAELVVIRA